LKEEINFRNRLTHVPNYSSTPTSIILPKEDEGDAHWQFLEGPSSRDSMWIAKRHKSFSFKGILANDAHVHGM